ncbi:hypothetical protein [Cognatishimia sp.]|uniref:hypothetical protein n=1 Tax=Cognatishimia sp. TaxID=2211648 RepID=UPI003BAC6278
MRVVETTFAVMCCAVFLFSSHAVANELVLLEARRLPQACGEPLSCIPQSQLLVRNIAALDQRESREIMSFLNRISSIRGISDTHIDTLNTSKAVIAKRYHAPAKAEKLDLLRHHPGVYFDTEKLDQKEDTQSFGSYVKTQLGAAGVKFLSKEDWEETPGRPTLTLRYSARRESEGCIIPFSVSLSISEEAVLVRDASLKVSGTIWAATTRQNLANTNYTSTSALRETVDKFLTDWKMAHR